MRLSFAKPFVRDYHSLPSAIQAAIDEALERLLADPHHPSLGIKKMQPRVRGIFEGRLSRGYRFTFEIRGDTYLLRRVGVHDILRTP